MSSASRFNKLDGNTRDIVWLVYYSTKGDVEEDGKEYEVDDVVAGEKTKKEWGRARKANHFHN